MIVDHIKNISFYNSLIPDLETAFAIVSEIAKDKDDGRYEFAGGFFLIQTGVTKPMEEGYFEAHKKYIDIQIVIEGSEEIAWAELEELKVETPYNPEKDALYLSGDTTCNMQITKDMFYIAFPHDGHRPVRHTHKQQNFKKIVLKLPV